MNTYYYYEPWKRPSVIVYDGNCALEYDLVGLKKWSANIHLHNVCYKSICEAVDEYRKRAGQDPYLKQGMKSWVPMFDYKEVERRMTIIELKS